MSEQRVHVWVQKFPDRRNLMLQWVEPETGRRKSKSAGTTEAKEAEQLRVDLEADLNHGRYAEAARMPWERFREIFEEEYLANRRPKSRATYLAVLDNFEAICRLRQLRGINERTISVFVAGLRKKKGRGSPQISEYTVWGQLNLLHSVLVYAKDQGLIPSVPRFPKVRVPQKTPRPVPAESFERMLAKAEDAQLQTLLLCGWLAGLRLAEALGLEREENDQAPWVDIARDRIWLPAAFVKAVKDQWVPLDQQLRQAVLALPRHGRKVFRFVTKPGKPVGEAAVSKRVADLARKAGVKLTMKTLRKGFGCYYAARVPAQVLQKLMRHSSIKITMDFYANVDEAVESAVLERGRNTLRNSEPLGDAVQSRGNDTNVFSGKTNDESTPSPSPAIP